MAEVRRYRAWCFTHNNYTPEEEEGWKRMNEEGKISYIIFQKELAPTTGTPHLQGFLYFRNPQTAKAVKKMQPKAVHWEACWASAKANKKYCTKLRTSEGKPIFEWGRFPKQGERTDIHKLKAMVKEGATMDELIEASTSYQSLRTAELLMKYQRPPQAEKKEVIWLWGETGTGKTKSAMEMAGEDYWISSGTLKWWDGYCGQKAVIIDDFRGDMCPLHTLLRILDRYPYRVETKGGSQWLRAKKIIITSCASPEQAYWQCTREKIGQLTRRITHTEELVGESEPEIEPVLKTSEHRGRRVILGRRPSEGKIWDKFQRRISVKMRPSA